MSVDTTTGSDVARRSRNRRRFAYWLLWVLVFFAAPGPVVFYSLRRGFDGWLFFWLGTVVVSTGIAALKDWLPGVESSPFIVHLGEEKPNAFYRRVCYTFAWSAILTFALLNLTDLGVGVVTGRGAPRELYVYAYFPLAAAVIALGAMGLLPRAKASTRCEGSERRYFYGAAWAAGLSQLALGVLVKLLPRTRETDALKLAIFIVMLFGLALCAKAGFLPRTQAVRERPHVAS